MEARPVQRKIAMYHHEKICEAFMCIACAKKSSYIRRCSVSAPIQGSWLLQLPAFYQIRILPKYPSILISSKSPSLFLSSSSNFKFPIRGRSQRKHEREKDQGLSQFGAMAMLAGMGLSRVVLLIGAGYTGSILVRNGRLSEMLDELQALAKGLQKSAKESGADSDVADALAMQVRRLAMEVRELASARPITVLNGNGQAGYMSSLLLPAAAVGAAGYGYMWWKGLRFSDLMYVTKKNMANAVSSMTKHLEQVSAALAATKRHLTQRIENLDGKLDEQKVISTEIKSEVTDVRLKITNIGSELDSLRGLVWGLNGKMNSLEDKQDFACAGVMYLCEFVADKDKKMPAFLKNAPKPKCHYLGYNEGLKQFMETIEPANVDKSQTDVNFQSDANSMDSLKSLSRTASIKC